MTLRAQQVEEARASAAQARAELAVVEVALDRTVLRAAIDGVVVRVGVDPGDFVATGQTAVSLADPGHAWVAANIEETEVARLRPGQEVRISVDEGGELQGRVEVVGQVAASQFALIPADSASGNFTKVVQRIPIRVALGGAHRPLRVGQSVTIRIVPGFVTLTTFLVALLYGLSKGNHEGWTSPLIVGCGLVAAFSLAAFLVVESVTTHRIRDQPEGERCEGRRRRARPGRVTARRQAPAPPRRDAVPSMP